MKYLKKYGFLKYAILLAVLDILSRDTFQIGGGVVALIAAVVAVILMEKEEKDTKKDHRRTMA